MSIVICAVPDVPTVLCLCCACCAVLCCAVPAVQDRDVPLDQRVERSAKFSDPGVCKHALAGLCHYGLFLNTKSDLGPCE